MDQMIVKVDNTASGRYNVVLYWGEGENIDREIVDSFQTFDAAERWAKIVAIEHRARYVAFRPFNFDTQHARIKLIKQYRDQGFSIRDAIKMAQAAYTG